MKTKISVFLLLSIFMLSMCACSIPFVDGEKKVAIIKNLNLDDNTKQFFDGAINEGELLGYKVDTFVTNSDDELMVEKLNEIIDSGYDGLIISHGKAEYSTEIIQRAVDKGIEVVTFDTIFEPIEGVTSTAQDDDQLARLTLDKIVAQSPNKPARVVKVWYDKTLAPSIKRNAVYEEYEKKGLIKTVYEIYPEVKSNEIIDAVAKEANAMDVDADFIWAEWDEMAKGIYNSSTTIPMVSIDISYDDIQMMLAQPERWVATAAVNSKTIGMINMRLLAQKMNNDETPAEYYIGASLIDAEVLTGTSNVNNLSTVVDGFDHDDECLMDWMKKIREENMQSIAVLTSDGSVFDDHFKELVYNGIHSFYNKAKIQVLEGSNEEELEKNIELAIDNKSDLIWGINDITSDTIEKAAQQYPETSFIVMNSKITKTAPNLTGVYFKGEEAAFLAGYVAAKSSKSGKVGFIGGTEREVITNIEKGYKNGVEYAKNGVSVVGDYVNSLNDTEVAENIASKQYADDVDIIFHAADVSGFGVIDAAKKNNKYVIGIVEDQKYLAPNNVLTSVTKNLSIVSHDITNRLLDGEQIGGKTFEYGLYENGVGIVTDNLDKSLSLEISVIKQKIIDGEINPLE